MRWYRFPDPLALASFAIRPQLRGQTLEFIPFNPVETPEKRQTGLSQMPVGPKTATPSPQNPNNPIGFAGLFSGVGENAERK